MTSEKAAIIEVVESVGTEVVTAVVGDLPGISTFVTALKAARGVMVERRLTMYALAATGGGTDEEKREAVRAFATSDDIAMATVHRMLDDDETAKAWFYGALLRAFVAGDVPSSTERLALLRFSGNVCAEDLKHFTGAARSSSSAAAPAKPGSETRLLGLFRNLSNRIELLRALELAGLTTLHDDNRPQLPHVDHGRILRLVDIAETAERMELQYSPLVSDR